MKRLVCLEQRTRVLSSRDHTESTFFSLLLLWTLWGKCYINLDSNFSMLMLCRIQVWSTVNTRNDDRAQHSNQANNSHLACLRLCTGSIATLLICMWTLVAFPCFSRSPQTWHSTSSPTVDTLAHLGNHNYFWLQSRSLATACMSLPCLKLALMPSYFLPSLESGSLSHANTCQVTH